MKLDNAYLAEFNEDKDADLRSVQQALRKAGLDFEEGEDNLFLDNPDRQNMSDAANALNRLGYNLRIDEGVFDKPTFALKGKDNLVLQKVGTALRIFFQE